MDLGLIIHLSEYFTTSTASVWLGYNRFITVTSHERHNVPKHRQHDCLFDSLLGLISEKISELPITSLCRESTTERWIPLTKGQWYDGKGVAITWRHNKHKTEKKNTACTMYTFLTRYSESMRNKQINFVFLVKGTFYFIKQIAETNRRIKH